MARLTDAERAGLEKNRRKPTEMSVPEEEMVDFSDEVPAGAMPVPPPPPVGIAKESPPTSAGPATITQNGALSTSDISKFAEIANGAPPAAPVVVPESEEAVAAAQPVSAGLKLDNCPKCGWDLEHAVHDEPDEDDKQEFIRSILGERRFVKRYTYLDNKVIFWFRSALKGEEMALSETLNQEIDDKKLRSAEEWHLRNRELRLSIELQSVEVAGNVQKFDEVFADRNYENMRDAMYAGVDKRTQWPGAIQSMAIYAQEQFENLHTTLVSRTYSSDFWSGLTDLEA